jgi:hypothetical protein
MKYADRSLSDVSIYGFNVDHFPDTIAVSSMVNFQITNHLGEEQGPEARITIATAVENGNPTIQDAERALVESALELIKRLAQETPETLFAKMESLRSKESYFAPKT